MSMSYAEASEYIWVADEAQGEQFAEWGSGATSLGYNAAEWAPAYDGYRTSDDPEYAQARAIIAEYDATCRRATAYAPRPTTAYDSADDLPF